jgi:hypothetical protein
MNTSFIHPPAGTDDAALKSLSDVFVDPSATGADQSDRACCCPAKAVVQVVLPPTATRPDATDLMLCGHHYRASRRELTAAHAVVRELPGMPRDTAAWIYDNHDRSSVPAEYANLPGRDVALGCAEDKRHEYADSCRLGGTGPESATGPAFGPMAWLKGT